MPKRVKVSRDGTFEIAGAAYSLGRSTTVLTLGDWQVTGPDGLTVVASAPTYREVRDLINRAAERGGF